MNIYQIISIIGAVIITAMFIYLVLNSLPKHTESRK